jgi:hypothetical protein
VGAHPRLREVVNKEIEAVREPAVGSSLQAECS